MVQHAQQSEDLYFQMHGLTAQAPEALNEALRRAIESMHRTLYAPSRDELTPSELALLDRAGVETIQPMRLLDLTGSFPTRAGASMGLMTGPRSVSRTWARAFHDSWPEIDGLYYPSSMYANHPAVALNERAREAGVMPDRASFHRSLGDPAILSILRNAAHALGYALL